MFLHANLNTYIFINYHVECPIQIDTGLIVYFVFCIYNNEKSHDGFRNGNELWSWTCIALNLKALLWTEYNNNELPDSRIVFFRLLTLLFRIKSFLFQCCMNMNRLMHCHLPVTFAFYMHYLNILSLSIATNIVGYNKEFFRIM